MTKKSKSYINCRKQLLVKNKLNFLMTVLTIIFVDFLEIEIVVMLKDFIETIESHQIELLYGVLKSGVFHIIAYLIIALFLSKFRNKFLHHALTRFKDYVFEHILEKSISDFGSKTSAKLMGELSDDLVCVESDYLVGSLTLFSVGFIFARTSVTIIEMEWRIAVPIIIIAVISVVFTIAFNSVDKNETKNPEENQSITNLTKDLLGGFTVIKSFKAEKRIMDIFRHRDIKLTTVNEHEGNAEIVHMYGRIAALFINIIVYGLGFWLAFTGEISIGMVIAFIQLKAFILEPVKTYGPLITKRKSSVAVIERISDMVDSVKNNRANPVKSDLVDIDVFKKEIVLENLSLNYSDGTASLTNVSLKFEKGKSYAIVGRSGSGKTTLIKTLLSYYPNYDGSIKIDGYELKKINVDSLYDDITAIFGNEIFLFDGTLRDNITVFTQVEKEVFDNAVNDSGLSNLVHTKGTEYPCGECGIRLSTADSRRIALARYLIRKTPILIADELDCSLDHDSAISVLNSMLDVKDATKIVVTTHLDENIMRKFDCIIVMRAYSVAEVGTYDELIAKKERFFSLVNLFHE